MKNLCHICYTLIHRHTTLLLIYINYEHTPPFSGLYTHKIIQTRTEKNKKKYSFSSRAMHTHKIFWMSTELNSCCNCVYTEPFLLHKRSGLSPNERPVRVHQSSNLFRNNNVQHACINTSRFYFVVRFKEWTMPWLPSMILSGDDWKNQVKLWAHDRLFAAAAGWGYPIIADSTWKLKVWCWIKEGSREKLNAFSSYIFWSSLWNHVLWVDFDFR